MTESQLEKFYNQRKKKLKQALDFIEKHKKTKDKINFIENAKSLINNDSSKEKIRTLFISCLNAAGGSNLTRNGPTSKNFHLKLERLSSNEQIDLKDFYQCFDSSISNFKELYEYLHESGELKNFGKKKSALFIYKLDWLQNNLKPSQKIFKNYSVDQKDLTIPLDVVIILILNKLLGIETGRPLDQYRDFNLINKFFKSKLGKKFILIEDLWFWGYFTTKGSGKNRTIEFNEDKFYTAEFIQPTDTNKNNIMEFLAI